MLNDVLILFTRWPEAGKAKTRLIPALGAEGSAELHERMARHAAGRAWAYCSATGTRLIVAYEGGTPAQMRDWLGPLSFQKQSSGDLGARLTHAVMCAHSAGAERMVIIGSDCPSLDETYLDAAFSSLAQHDVVLGPVTDGGYCLIGMKGPRLELFADIPWSTHAVFDATLGRAQALGFRTATLALLADVDEPADLPHAKEALAAGQSLSVIIPSLNDATALDTLLPMVVAANPLEVIVADGGSTDDTRSAARRYGVELLDTPRGRAQQMNAAARRARGEFLLFLHADTLPPENYDNIIARELSRPGVAAGAFRFSLREETPWRLLIEKPTQWRGARLSLPYGDQGLFLRRSIFTRLGGYADWPLLEDVELVRRLRGLGQVVITRETAPTSARRWLSGGVVRTFIRHQLILIGHAIGIPPEKLTALR